MSEDIRSYTRGDIVFDDNGLIDATIFVTKEDHDKVLKELQYFKDTSIGLWVTDKPEVITEEQKSVFWELK